MSKDYKEVIEDVKKAFSSLVILAPFTYPLLTMPVIIREKMIAIAATDGVTIYVNPEEWLKASFKEKMFTAYHEWLHVAFLHSKRIKTKDSRIYNYAADFLINGMIINDLGEKLECNNILYDNYYYNKTTEEIYKDLDNEIKKRQEEKQTPFCFHCKRDLHVEDYLDGLWKDPKIKKCPVCLRPTNEDIVKPLYLNREDAINQLMIEKFGAPWGNDIFELPKDADEQSIMDNVLKAAAYFKNLGRGTLPGMYEDYINQLKSNNIPWERLLLRYAKELVGGSSDRNPYRPDSKYLPFDILIPTEVSNTVSKLVFIIDTSGSMNTEDFEKAAGCIKKLHTFCDKIIVIMADTMVQKVVRVKNIEAELKKGFNLTGRGGTDMHEAMEVADKLNPNVIILFSDMMIGGYPEKPKSPVIWIDSYNDVNIKPPYGIYIKVKDRNFI